MPCEEQVVIPCRCGESKVSYPTLFTYPFKADNPFISRLLFNATPTKKPPCLRPQRSSANESVDRSDHAESTNVAGSAVLLRGKPNPRARSERLIRLGWRRTKGGGMNVSWFVGRC